MREVAKDVFCVGGTDVNWVLVREGSDLTLIDGGWRGDLPAVERSIRALGRRPEDIRAILLTHAHLDHLGALNHFHDRYGTPVYMDPAEVPHARDGRLEQATPLDVARRAWRPAVLAWSARIIRAGALRHTSVPHARPFPADGPLDLPGRPVPVTCHGHTSGHSAYHLPAAGAVATGDALVTGHPLTRRHGPQLLPGFFAHSPDEALAALDVLDGLDADLVLPGHGLPWRGSLAEAVATARERAAGT
ncbi:MBL fold metallo-hydrolase [Amycolatopsis suaedae]|uniref:MBL fold metallo-hydrolase n=1 Tax=Amycolatopsis suaedae TaxID=2510978 RepID=A0A4Q7J4E6_9PSEU|nr:MBL fold metallo-hydrolase [Amycolatopsis suaedae]RZQ62430.1 MBL fold metallo-hydrolase [Amycolatopsis suaedae]